jgi:hypothetical protein
MAPSGHLVMAVLGLAWLTAVVLWPDVKKWYSGPTDVEGAVGAPISSQTVFTLDFKYLPQSPLDHGWKQEYNADGEAEYGSDLDIPESLRIKILKSEVAIEYNLPPHAALADHIEFAAKYTNSTMIFTRLMVASKDGRVQKQVDVKYYYGDLRAVRTSPNPNPGRDAEKWLPEQTIYWPAELLSGGRLAFNIDLREAIKLSLGEQGWMFRSIQGVRLRSNLSISPIVFGKSTSTASYSYSSGTSKHEPSSSFRQYHPAPCASACS